jgi:hypothetical protein
VVFLAHLGLSAASLVDTGLHREAVPTVGAGGGAEKQGLELVIWAGETEAAGRGEGSKGGWQVDEPLRLWGCKAQRTLLAGSGG